MDNTQLELNKRVFVASFFELSLGLLAVGLGLWLGPHPHATMPRIYEGMRFSEGLLDGFLVGMLMLYIILWLERRDFAWVRQISNVTEAVFLNMMRGASPWHFLALSLAAGVGEELLFRGWLQSFLELKFSSLGELAPWVAIVLSSLVFGLVHPLSRGYIFLAFLLGCLLGVAYHTTGNIMVPIIAHTLYDFVLMLRMVIMARRKENVK